MISLTEKLAQSSFFLGTTYEDDPSLQSFLTPLLCAVAGDIVAVGVFPDIDSDFDLKTLKEQDLYFLVKTNTSFDICDTGDVKGDVLEAYKHWHTTSANSTQWKFVLTVETAYDFNPPTPLKVDTPPISSPKIYREPHNETFKSERQKITKMTR
jgi:hypothetical protein